MTHRSVTSPADKLLAMLQDDPDEDERLPLDAVVAVDGPASETVPPPTADAVDVDAIRAEGFNEGYTAGAADARGVLCPHTATAAHARARIGTPHWVVVATAHPAKFESVVEPLVGREVEPPPCLAELFEQPSQYEELDPTFDALAEALK